MINADHASRIILAPMSMSIKSTLEYTLNKELKYSKIKIKIGAADSEKYRKKYWNPN